MVKTEVQIFLSVAAGFWHVIWPLQKAAAHSSGMFLVVWPLHLPDIGQGVVDFSSGLSWPLHLAAGTVGNSSYEPKSPFLSLNHLQRFQTHQIASPSPNRDKCICNAPKSTLNASKWTNWELKWLLKLCKYTKYHIHINSLTTRKKHCSKGNIIWHAFVCRPPQWIYVVLFWEEWIYVVKKQFYETLLFFVF